MLTVQKNPSTKIIEENNVKETIKSPIDVKTAKTKPKTRTSQQLNTETIKPLISVNCLDRIGEDDDCSSESVNIPISAKYKIPQSKNESTKNSQRLK